MNINQEIQDKVIELIKEKCGDARFKNILHNDNKLPIKSVTVITFDEDTKLVFDNTYLTRLYNMLDYRDNDPFDNILKTFVANTETNVLNAIITNWEKVPHYELYTDLLYDYRRLPNGMRCLLEPLIPIYQSNGIYDVQSQNIREIVKHIRDNCYRNPKDFKDTLYRYVEQLDVQLVKNCIENFKNNAGSIEPTEDALSPD